MGGKPKSHTTLISHIVLDFMTYTYIGEVFQKNYKEDNYKEKMLEQNNIHKLMLANMCSGVFWKEAVMNYSASLAEGGVCVYVYIQVHNIYIHTHM